MIDSIIVVGGKARVEKVESGGPVRVGSARVPIPGGLCVSQGTIRLSIRRPYWHLTFYLVLSSGEGSVPPYKIGTNLV